MQKHASYDDVVGTVRDYLAGRAAAAAAGGVQEVWIDPGIGFGKTAAHNLLLLRYFRPLVDTGWPVLVGTSRKSFLGALSAGPGEEATPAEDRLEATIASTTWAIVQGAAMVRVHDVVPAVQAAQLAGEAPSLAPREDPWR